MSQVTNCINVYMIQTVNRREHLNLAKFKSCGARTNRGGIKLNFKLRRGKAQTNSGWKKHNCYDVEWISKILEVTLQQSLVMEDKAKCDLW